MGFSPIQKIEGNDPILSTDNWSPQYKNGFVEAHHDTSQLHLVLPDDCLIVSGPPRLSHTGSADSFYPIGFISNLTLSETRNVQPLKGIGSRRHIFAATNAPVQGSIGRMLFMGRNLSASFYANAEFGQHIVDRNSGYSSENSNDGNGAYYVNAEEDIFRVPFGLGIILNSPASLAGDKVHVSAYYVEVCTIMNNNISITPGQPTVLEQVNFMADRVLAWDSYTTLVKDVKAPVGLVSNMG